MKFFDLLKNSSSKGSGIPSGVEFVVIDVETSGLSPNTNRIVEIALVKSDGKQIIENWVRLINPEGPVGPTEIHGIHQDDVEDAPKFKEIAKDIFEKINGYALVAHNAKFDLAFLKTEFNRIGLEIANLPNICTFEASRYYLPELNRRKLIDCCNEVGIKIENKHSALGDAVATSQLFSYFMLETKEPEPRLSDLRILNNPGKLKISEFKGEIEIPSQKEISPKYRSIPVSKSRKSLIQKFQNSNLSKILGRTFLDDELQYLEKLAEALGDYSLSPDEVTSLNDLAKIYNLSESRIHDLNELFVVALASIAYEDERIENSEKEELIKILNLLGFSETALKNFLEKGKNSHHELLASKVKPLPTNWNLGEPLKIGDGIVFTGCDPDWRFKIENECSKKGLFVTSSVSKKTKFLVSDGSYSGNKMRDAQKLGTRIVTPDEFNDLLEFIQPK